MSLFLFNDGKLFYNFYHFLNVLLFIFSTFSEKLQTCLTLKLFSIAIILKGVLIHAITYSLLIHLMSPVLFALLKVAKF